MSLTGVTFANQKITPSDDGRLYGGILSDGILTGCAVTFAAATLSIAAGSMLIGTRELRTSGETLSLTGATSGYARVIVDIDLTRAATKTSFEQAQLQIQYAASQSAFPALVQQDINAAGTHYQAIFCVVSLGSAGITAVVSKLATARIASGRLGNGAVQTANLGDGVVTRAKLAQDAIGKKVDWAANSTPISAAYNGYFVYMRNTDAKSFTITADDFATLPDGYTITILALACRPVTISWDSGLPVMDAVQRTANSAGGSITLNGNGDMITIFKRPADGTSIAAGLIITGQLNPRTIWVGSSATPPGDWQPGDIYFQYEA